MSGAPRWVVGAGAVELAVHESGVAQAPTVLLVHGYPDTSAVWDGVAERLAERYHVVTYDVRGAGASGAPDCRRGYGLDRLVEDMASVARAVSPDRPIHLVGHDWGSVQGWEAVTTELLRGRIASFTSVSGPGLDHVGQWVAARTTLRPRALAQLLRQGLRSWYVTAFHLPGATLFWRLGGDRTVTRSLVRMGELPAGTEPAPTLAGDGARGINLYRANIVPRLRRPGQRRTDVPVQLIVPSGDRFVTPALLDDTARWASRLWRRDVPGRHWLPRVHPDRVARWVAELVEHVEGGTDTGTLDRHRVEPMAASTGSERSARRGRAGAGWTARSGRAGDPATAPPDVERGKVVVVTGAGSGIGRQTALAFAERGAEIVAVDIDAGTSARTALLCRALGAVATHQQVDVGDAHAMEALAKLVEHDHGGADVVVNNAGIGIAGGVLDTSDDDWERILRVNLWGVIHGSRLFAQQMVDRGEGGHIVNVASAAAFTPSRALPAYATTKAAVLMLTECLRAELAGRDVGVTAICPGIVDTGITTSTRFVGVDDDEQDRRRQLMKRLYARRSFGPEKVADAIVRAVRRDAAVVPVTPEAHAARALSRIAPGLSRRLARLDPTRGR